MTPQLSPERFHSDEGLDIQGSGQRRKLSP
jgi:hypothetical protein